MAPKRNNILHLRREPYRWRIVAGFASTDISLQSATEPGYFIMEDENRNYSLYMKNENNLLPPLYTTFLIVNTSNTYQFFSYSRVGESMAALGNAILGKSGGGVSSKWKLTQFQEKSKMEPCSWATYLAEDDDELCTPCPRGTSTLGEGATSLKECLG